MAQGTPYGSNYVGGEGPVPCRFMLIGEGPGEDEDRQGRPFVGKSGVELWRYLWRGCQLTREEVYTTNLIKFRVPDNGDPTEEDIARDAPELERELATVNPEFVLSLGRWATRYLLGDVDMDCVHGVAHCRDSYCVVPCIHPAAGLHNTEFQAKIAWDFEQAGKAIRGQADAPVERFDEFVDPFYDFSRFPVDDVKIPGITAVDTEGSVAKPWCVTFSQTPGKAGIARRGRVNFEHVILHNSLHDLGVLEALQCAIDSFDDTMIMAYELGIEPQGLKNLARRHCGMVMKSYEEVLGDAQKRHNLQWLVKVLNSALTESAATTPKRGLKKSTSQRDGKRSARTSPTRRPR